MTRPRAARLLTLLAAGLLLLLGLQAAPASAEVFCSGGHSVDGAIWTEYTQTPGVQQALGCPITDELALPDGVGRRQVFSGGSIYWSPATGAHAVWGLIGQKWGEYGWEGGSIGYPLTDELKNPDGKGVRQQFQQATIYWSPATGAHPVRGLIGWYWGQNGYERGRYGYPTTDETDSGKIGGVLDSNAGVKQGFEKSKYLLYSPGRADAYETCHSQCLGYGGITDSKWVKKTEVYINLSDRNLRSVHVTPTDDAFASLNPTRTTAVDDMENLWKQVWANTHTFPNYTQTELNSVYQQLYCHAKYSFPNGSGGHFGGPTWDLEVWRADIGMDTDKMLKTGCNW
ncbi:DUF2599 domain-containing protein [Streptomyces caatingaensis]|uniref:DUF2599 domain-containing protein n=1 Tax=Streptomyces caatingaensis TaxID=1678637 RepID=UPI0006727C21|nr:DUF2599 domain-containing protein [Streptomyces caatingaensis]